MRKIMVLGLVLLLGGAAFAQTKSTAKKSDPARAAKDDVVRTAKQFIAGFNKGDIASALATCASPASIIDEFPPYAWTGPNACADWAAAYDAGAKQEGMTGGHVTMGVPLHVEVLGDRGYLIVPVSFRYKLKGKPVTESGARLTVALEKQGSDWKITAWAWSKH